MKITATSHFLTVCYTPVCCSNTPHGCGRLYRLVSGLCAAKSLERASGDERLTVSGNERASGNETNCMVGTSDSLGTRQTSQWERASVWGRD